MSEPAAALEPIKADAAAGLWVRAEYAERGYGLASRTLWAAPATILALRHAARTLAGAGLGLLVLDGWRPLELQRELFEEYRERLIASTGLVGSELEAHVARFVTDPERASAPPAHSTGGAVDVTLCDPTGTALDLGGAFDELTDRSQSDHYDDAAAAPARTFAARREQLRAAMHAAGFERLPSEWWHFELGTQLWADASPGRTSTLTRSVDAPTGWSAVGRA